ncbi:hypothetical protein GOBAR_DD21134 [Gossypium barbadense]|nr:hypothetical protein GOBAR_DD21134 [Gossypium barbadense]
MAIETYRLRSLRLGWYEPTPNDGIARDKDGQTVVCSLPSGGVCARSMLKRSLYAVMRTITGRGLPGAKCLYKDERGGVTGLMTGSSMGPFVQAAWTRRSRGEAAKQPNRKSWKQRTDMYMRPFLLNVFFSKKFIHAKVMHRGTSKVILVATTNAKDLRNNLASLTDHNACKIIGKLIAEQSKEADVYAMSYKPRKGERIEGKLGIVLDTIKENGIIITHWCSKLISELWECNQYLSLLILE